MQVGNQLSNTPAGAVPSVATPNVELPLTRPTFERKEVAQPIAFGGLPPGKPKSDHIKDCLNDNQVPTTSAATHSLERENNRLQLVTPTKIRESSVEDRGLTPLMHAYSYENLATVHAQALHTMGMPPLEELRRQHSGLNLHRKSEIETHQQRNVEDLSFIRNMQARRLKQKIIPQPAPKFVRDQLYVGDITKGEGMGQWGEQKVFFNNTKKVSPSISPDSAYSSPDRQPSKLGLKSLHGQSAILLKNHKVVPPYHIEPEFPRQSSEQVLIRPSILRNVDIEGSMPRSKYKPKNYDFMDYSDVSREVSRRLARAPNAPADLKPSQILPHQLQIKLQHNNASGKEMETILENLKSKFQVESIKLQRDREQKSRNALRPFKTDLTPSINGYSSYQAMKALKAAGALSGEKRIIEPLKGKKVYPEGRAPYLPLIRSPDASASPTGRNEETSNSPQQFQTIDQREAIDSYDLEKPKTPIFKQMMAKNANNAQISRELKAQYAASQFVENAYAALSTQPMTRLSNYGYTGLKMQSDIPGAQTGSKRHTTYKGPLLRKVNPTAPFYKYPGLTELQSRTISPAPEIRLKSKAISKARLDSLQSANQNFVRAVGDEQTRSRRYFHEHQIKITY